MFSKNNYHGIGTYNGWKTRDNQWRKWYGTAGQKWTRSNHTSMNEKNENDKEKTIAGTRTVIQRFLRNEKLQYIYLAPRICTELWKPVLLICLLNYINNHFTLLYLNSLSTIRIRMGTCNVKVVWLSKNIGFFKY